MNPNEPRPADDPPPQPPPLSGWAATLLGLLGVALLLPGLCSLVFMIISKGQAASSFWNLWIVTYLIAAGGIALLVWVIRNRR